MNVLNQLIDSAQRWAMYQGDCVETLRGIPDNSIHYSIFSPPFASLYTYSNSDRDMGNSSDGAEFAQHFGYLVAELYRVIMPGRLVSIHCMNLPAMKSRDGFIGIKDFRGDIIREMTEYGFIFHSEVCIWKNPVTEMQRTKALGLLHKQIRKDSAMSRQGLPDYVVTFRKPGENPEPIPHDHDSFPVDVWQKYASPVWMDVRQSNTLQRKSARDEKDEKHICPLQLDVIERCIDLWTNPGDIVLFHNDSKYILQALPQILEYYQRAGYRVIPISELLLEGETWIDHAGTQHLATPPPSASTGNESRKIEQ